MLKVTIAGVLLAAAPAQARPTHATHPLYVHRAPDFLTVLDRNGSLSAGWIDVLPGLATACKFRIDNQELTSRLIDLSHDAGNISYTRDLYTSLRMIKDRHTANSFGRAWMARFDGRDKEACETAETLWGEGGHQFPGVLKREAMDDGGLPPSTPPSNNCK